MKLRVPPPACIPATVNNIASFKAWFASKRVEDSLVGNHYDPNPEYYNDNEFEIRHWLHICYDKQPEVTAVAEEFGWRLAPSYYYLQLRRRFKVEWENGFWKIKPLPGYDNRKKPMKHREFQSSIANKPEAQKLERLIRQIFLQTKLSKPLELLFESDITSVTALHDVDNRPIDNQRLDYLHKGDIALIFCYHGSDNPYGLCHVLCPNTGKPIIALRQLGYHQSPGFHLDSRPEELIYIETDLLDKSKLVLHKHNKGKKKSLTK